MSDPESSNTEDEQLIELIVSWYEPEWTTECKALHTRIAEAKATGVLTDQILNECQQPECAACARICCPHHEPLHFHHDGCPACETL